MIENNKIMLTDKQIKEQYNKLKQIDKLAKDLGFTIYRIDCDFNVNGNIYTHIETSLNKPSKQYVECLEDMKINKEKFKKYLLYQ